MEMVHDSLDIITSPTFVTLPNLVALSQRFYICGPGTPGGPRQFARWSARVSQKKKTEKDPLHGYRATKTKHIPVFHFYSKNRRHCICWLTFWQWTRLQRKSLRILWTAFWTTFNNCHIISTSISVTTTRAYLTGFEIRLNVSLLI